MLPHIRCYNAEIICIKQGNNLFFFYVSRDIIEDVIEIVAYVLLVGDVLNDRIESEDEDDGAHWVTLKYSTLEGKDF